ncbi:MAG: PLP-dependent aminotransferase family protein [Rhodobacteraceae bacterium]|nr:PLP-dependent aminotransferase family protein [Paracoccaceae bacterium]
MGREYSLDSLQIDRTGAENLHRQIYAQVRNLIEARVLASGSALPSTRELSRVLGVGRNSVIAAYDQLALEGYLRLRRGARPLVVELPARARPAPAAGGRAVDVLSARGRLLQAQAYHSGRPGHLVLHPGMPDPDNFPFDTWARLLSRRARHARHDLFGAYHLQGYPPLREAIARYATVSRGVNCGPDQIVVTNGAQSAFDLLARLLIDPGDAVWMEEPGYYGARAALVSAGASLVPLHVDRGGWRLDPPTRPPRLIFVTPSCHYPLGITMPMEQRLNLLRLAEASDALIIEDDYDSEYRFQGQPIPALQGLDVSGRVVFVGTFAKILFPAMRLGFVVLPPAICDRIVPALATTGHFAPLVTQAALADFINAGHLTRHLRRTRRLYAQRREAFYAAFDAHLSPWLSLQRTGTGIQQVARFHGAVDDRAFVAASAAEGINVSALSMQYHGRAAHPGLLLGFASADQREQERALRRLGLLARRLAEPLAAASLPDGTVRASAATGSGGEGA